MTELEMEMKIAELQKQLVTLDEEKQLTFKLEEVREKHRTLPSPDSPTILFLVRAMITARGEINRLKKIIKIREQAEKDRQAAKERARGVYVRLENEVVE